jgi:hypothetical protein
MAFYQSKQVKAGAQAPSPDEAFDVIPVTAEFVTPTGGVAIGDIIEMGALPDNCIPLDLIVHTGVLGASVTLDAGMVSGVYAKNDAARTMGNEFLAAGVAATAVMLRCTKSLGAIAPNDSPRGWGLKVGGATTSAGITIRATLLCAVAPLGVVNV